MKIISRLKFGSTAVCVCLALSGCGFVAQQLSDKQLETQLLKPGALDAPVAEHYDTYQYRFLNKYRVTHDWLGISSCGYRGMWTSVRVNRAIPALNAVRDIYEENDKTWQRFDPPLKPYDFDRYVRSLKETVPVMEAGKQVGTRERENGLSTMCLEVWVATSHATTLMLYKRSVSAWDKELNGTWQQGAYSGPYSKKSVELVGGNTWQVRRVEIQPRVGTRISGAFELWILPIGDTGYTIALELGANLDSLKTLKAHAQFQTIFRHLIESVKIEALTPQIQAELAQNAQKAQAIQLNDCQKNSCERKAVAKTLVPARAWLALPARKEIEP